MLLEKNIDDYWNVDGERELSDAWTGFTRFIHCTDRNATLVSSSLNQLTKFKFTMKSARRRLEVPIPAAMPCKTTVNCRRETCSSIEKRKTQNACIVDADESMRIRLEGVPQRYHEDHITAQGVNSLSHHNLVHEFIPMFRALKYRKQRRQWKKHGKFGKNSGMTADESQKQERSDR